MNKKNPAIFIKNLLDKYDLSVTDAAPMLGVSRCHLSNLIHGKFAITPEMAIRLEKVFGTDAKTWLLQQLDYDFALAKKEFKEKGIKLKRLKERDTKI